MYLIWALPLFVILGMILLGSVLIIASTLWHVALELARWGLPKMENADRWLHRFRFWRDLPMA